MDQIFALFDEVTGEHLSYHKTLPGALIAMSIAIDKVAPALCKDYGDDDEVDFTMKYRIKSYKVEN